MTPEQITDEIMQDVAAEVGGDSGIWPDDVVAVANVLIARGLLVEVPADDGEPITPDWLRSVGFEEDDSDLIRFTMTISPSDGEYQGQQLGILKYDSESWVAEMRLVGTPWSDSIGTPGYSTRGHVRRLCASLGCPLTEGGAT